MNLENKPRVATVWLSGCSGCHMSFLDQDERLINIAAKVQFVYSPIMDVKVFPENVDVTLVEGAVANEEQLELLKQVRERTKILISLGDCAVTGNVTGLRNTVQNSVESTLKKAFIETADVNGQIPNEVPKILKQTVPLHEIVKVDYYIPGCPPSADTINYVLTELLAGRTPNMENRSKYG
ncbi:oxidoreductase [Candidatus Bathyarchaeota archaeon]|nr:oxidoreductase [Candidatus Bathyarchaeota archaeon]